MFLGVPEGKEWIEQRFETAILVNQWPVKTHSYYTTIVIFRKWLN
ncbi:hypothetical protein [Bombilactobacillus thymidiniphilus]|nr:hypothetical protein [Bombilactobacillus thymidiniphilus]